VMKCEVFCSLDSSDFDPEKELNVVHAVLLSINTLRELKFDSESQPIFK